MSAISTHIDASSSRFSGRTRCTALAFALLITVAARAVADEEKAPPIPPPHPVPIQAYATDNPSCLEWTDGCTICTKPDSGEPHCSTPGIACQPAGIQCKKKAP
jgi:hypothetical protein